MTLKEFTLLELAKLTNSKLIGDAKHLITGVNALDQAKPHEASFLANSRYEEAMRSTQAGVICIDPSIQSIQEGKNYLVSDDPSRIFQEIAEITLTIKPKIGFKGIHPSVVIHKTAKIGKNVTIGPFSVIDQDTVIEDNTTISSHCYVGCNVHVGSDCFFYSSVVVREGCVIGKRVVLQPGAIIGSCGFGFTPDKAGSHQKLKQIGNVIIEDDVEIGANSTVDRARFKVTIIRKGTKIDNLVQVAHNVDIGEHSVIAAQTGIAGSAKVGKGVMMGGQVGVLGHVEISDRALIATRGGVSKSLLKPGKYRGSPAIAIHEYNRQKVHVRKLEKYVKRIEELEKKLEALESSIEKK